MSLSLIIFIIIHLVVLAFFIESLRRIAYRAKEYPLEDNRNTMPFAFIKLRYIVILYIITYLIWILFSIWLYYLFIGGESSVIPKYQRLNNPILDL